MVKSIAQTKLISREQFVIGCPRIAPVAEKIEQATGCKLFPLTQEQIIRNDIGITTPIGLFVWLMSSQASSSFRYADKMKSLWPYVPLIGIGDTPSGHLIQLAFANGIDDVIFRPIDNMELRARFYARRRDYDRIFSQVEVPFEDIIINVPRRVLSGKLGKCYLPTLEIELLLCLINYNGLVVPRRELIDRVWKNVKVSTNAIEARVSSLRRALTNVSEKLVIKAVYGVGYMLTEKGS